MVGAAASEPRGSQGCAAPRGCRVRRSELWPGRAAMHTRREAASGCSKWPALLLIDDDSEHASSAAEAVRC